MIPQKTASSALWWTRTAGKAHAVPEQLDSSPALSPTASPTAATPDAHGLSSRYAPVASVRGRRLKIAGAVTGIALGVAGAAYFSFGNPGSAVRGQEVSYSVKSSEMVEMTFNVAKPQDATVQCTLNALNTNYAQVGTKTVMIGPSDVGEAQFTVQIATTELAVTAVIESCELSD